MADKSYTQKVNEWLLPNAGCTVLDCCIKFGYYPVAVKIMGLDDGNKEQIQKALRADKDLKELYVKYANDSRANARKGKNRNWTTYFQDIISGWVLEDLVMEKFRRQGIDIRHNGKDFQRVIDIGEEVAQEADCVITVGDITRKVELSNELNTFLKNEGYIEKRSPAIYNLWKNKVIWLYSELKSGKYVLIDFARENTKVHLRYHETWDKDAHRYILGENGKKVRDDRLLAAELISVVGCGIDGVEQPTLNEVMDTDMPPHEWDIGGKRKQTIASVQKVKEEVKETRPVKLVQTKKIEKKSNPSPAPQPPETTPMIVQGEEEEPISVADVLDDSDDGVTDWNAVAMANAQELEF